MLIGKVLMKGVVIYTGWEPRGGDAGTILFEVLKLSAGATVDIHVEHKNLADTSVSDLGDFTQITTTGVHSKHFSAIKELVRLEITIGGNDGYDWALVRELDIAWEAD